MDIKDDEEVKPTQGSKKINNYFSALIKSDYFNNFADNSRKKYNIPRLGFANTEKYYGFLASPKEWEADTGKNSKYDNLIDEIINFCKEKKLLYFNSYTEIYDFIVYNKPIGLIEDDLCIIRDTGRGKEMMEDEEGKQIIEDFDGLDNSIYPISIKISPYASQRDIIDFIKKYSKRIKEFQKMYIIDDIKIGKYKSKKIEIQERNDFIYKNRNKSLKEISKLLSERGGDNKLYDIDIGHISKIISLEKQKRKEV